MRVQSSCFGFFYLILKKLFFILQTQKESSKFVHGTCCLCRPSLTCILSNTHCSFPPINKLEPQYKRLSVLCLCRKKRIKSANHQRTDFTFRDELLIFCRCPRVLKSVQPEQTSLRSTFFSLCFFYYFKLYLLLVGSKTPALFIAGKLPRCRSRLHSNALTFKAVSFITMILSLSFRALYQKKWDSIPIRNRQHCHIKLLALQCVVMVIHLNIPESHRFTILRRLYWFTFRWTEENFEPKPRDITRDWRKRRNLELHSLYSAPYIIRVINYRRIRWTGHVARRRR